MRTYEKYKPSGIDWIGDIPEHWGTQRLKYFARILNGQDHKGVWDEDGEYPIMGTGGEFGRGNSYLHRGPSVLLGRKGTIDKPIFVDFPFWSVDTAYFTEIYPETHPRYFFYLCRNIQFDKIKYGSAVPSMTQEVLNQVLFPVPSLEEQTAIADYLDKETARIDEVVGKKKRLIELLKEERLAIINQAVTRGLDPNAKLKPSNIEWLGDIPEHWTSSKVRFVARVVRGASPRPAGDPEFFDGDHTPWITVAEVTKHDQKFIVEVSEYLTEEGAKRSRFVDIGTLLLSNSGATLGVPKILKVGGCINDGSVAFLDLNPEVSIDFLYYFFVSHTEIYRELAAGSGQPNLNTDIVKSTPFSFPSIPEQSKIVQHIEERIWQIEATAGKVEKEIGLLNEYRTALISEVVTGRIDVRN